MTYEFDSGEDDEQDGDIPVWDATIKISDEGGEVIEEAELESFSVGVANGCSIQPTPEGRKVPRIRSSKFGAVSTTRREESDTDESEESGDGSHWFSWKGSFKGEWKFKKPIEAELEDAEIDADAVIEELENDE